MADTLSTDQTQKILAACPAGMGIVKGNLLDWGNKTLYALLGYAQGSLAGRNVEVFFPTENAFVTVKSRIESGIKTHGTGMVETRILRKTGSGMDCRLSAAFLDPVDPHQGILVMVEDTTRENSRRIQCRQAEKMEAIGVLAGGISHDFNNLLMGIQGHLSLMRINLDHKERTAAHIHRITKLVETAAELTNRLLGFARGGKYRIETLDVNDMVEMALNVFRSGHGDRDVTPHRAYARDLHPIQGDRSQIEQVCLNILVNADQAMMGGGDLFVSTKNVEVRDDHVYPFEVTPGPYVEIGIRDTGKGMDPEIQKKIFDPFFSTKDIGDKKGQGLGLSTVFGIVKNHGGFLLVDSKRGEGTCFRVCLPAAPRENQGGPAGDGDEPLSAMLRGSETVLLVDDEEEIINVGKNFLEKLGYRAMTARNGLEAIEIFKTYKDEIALVVLDLVMPKMGGEQTFVRLKEIREDIKILVATGYTMDREVEGLLKWGCNGFLQKPFSMRDFSKAVRGILDEHPVDLS